MLTFFLDADVPRHLVCVLWHERTTFWVVAHTYFVSLLLRLLYLQARSFLIRTIRASSRPFHQSEIDVGIMSHGVMGWAAPPLPPSLSFFSLLAHTPRFQLIGNMAPASLRKVYQKSWYITRQPPRTQFHSTPLSVKASYGGDTADWLRFILLFINILPRRI